MIGRMLKGFARHTAEKTLKNYMMMIEGGDYQQRSLLLAHASLVYTEQLINIPEVEVILFSPVTPSVSSEIANDFVLLTNEMLKKYTGQIFNTAGMTLWNQTFRCLRHSELTLYGTRIWSSVSQFSDMAEAYLESLRGRNLSDAGDYIFGDIDEAIRICHKCPYRFMSGR